MLALLLVPLLVTAVAGDSVFSSIIRVQDLPLGNTDFTFGDRSLFYFSSSGSDVAIAYENNIKLVIGGTSYQLYKDGAQKTTANNSKAPFDSTIASTTITLINGNNQTADYDYPGIIYVLSSDAEKTSQVFDVVQPRSSFVPVNSGAEYFVTILSAWASTEMTNFGPGKGFPLTTLYAGGYYEAHDDAYKLRDLSTLPSVGSSFEVREYATTLKVASSSNQISFSAHYNIYNGNRTVPMKHGDTMLTMSKNYKTGYPDVNENTGIVYNCPQSTFTVTLSGDFTQNAQLKLACSGKGAVSSGNVFQNVNPSNVQYTYIGDTLLVGYTAGGSNTTGYFATIDCNGSGVAASLMAMLFVITRLF